MAKKLGRPRIIRRLFSGVTSLSSFVKWVIRVAREGSVKSSSDSFSVNFRRMGNVLGSVKSMRPILIILIRVSRLLIEEY